MAESISYQDPPENIDAKTNNVNKAMTSKPPSSTSSNSPSHKDREMKKEKDKEREERVRLLRERQDLERKQRIEDLREAQRLAEEYRQRQQDERRQKIDEMRRRENERRAAVDERRRQHADIEKMKREAILHRNSERLARYEQWKMTGRSKAEKSVGTFGTSRMYASTSVLCQRPTAAARAAHVDSQPISCTTSLRHIPSALDSIPEKRGRSFLASQPHRPRSMMTLSSTKGADNSARPSPRKPRPVSMIVTGTSNALSVVASPRSKSTDRTGKANVPAKDAGDTSVTPPRSVRRATFDRLATPKQRDVAGDQTANRETTPSKTVSIARTPVRNPSPRKLPPRPKESPAQTKERDKTRREPSATKTRTKPPGDAMSKSMHEMLSPSSSEPRKQFKNDVMSRSTTDIPAKSLHDITEEEYKAKIAEKRKEAREKALRESELLRAKEEQERLEEEERLKREEEEERRMEEEAERMAAEARQAEETRLKLAIEAESERKRLEAERLETERIAKEEAERRARDEAEKLEKERLEKARLVEEERLERKRKLEMIMKRVKTDSPVPSDSNKMSDSLTKLQMSPSRSADVGVADRVAGSREAVTVEDDAVSSDGQRDDDSADERRSTEDSTEEREPSVSDGRSQFKSPLLKQLMEKRGAGDSGESHKFKSPLLQNMLGGSGGVGKQVTFKGSSELLNRISPSSSRNFDRIENTDDSSRATSSGDESRSAVDSEVSDICDGGLQVGERLMDISPVVGDISPAIDNISPATGDISPAIDNISPATGDISPPIDNISPATGDISPAIDNISPATGDISPPIYNISPATGDISPPIDNIFPATGDIPLATRDICPTTGNILVDDNIAPLTGNISPATDDKPPANDNIPPLTGDIYPAYDDITPAMGKISPVTPATRDILSFSVDTPTVTDDIASDKVPSVTTSEVSHFVDISHPRDNVDSLSVGGSDVSQQFVNEATDVCHENISSGEEDSNSETGSEKSPVIGKKTVSFMDDSKHVNMDNSLHKFDLMSNQDTFVHDTNDSVFNSTQVDTTCEEKIFFDTEDSPLEKPDFNIGVEKHGIKDDLLFDNISFENNKNTMDSDFISNGDKLFIRHGDAAVMENSMHQESEEEISRHQNFDEEISTLKEEDVIPKDSDKENSIHKKSDEENSINKESDEENSINKESDEESSIQEDSDKENSILANSFEYTNHNVDVDLSAVNQEAASRDSVICPTFPTLAWPDHLNVTDVNGEVTSGESSPGDIPQTLVDSSISMRSDDTNSPSSVRPELMSLVDSAYLGEDQESVAVISHKTTHQLSNSSQQQYVTSPGDIDAADLINYNTLSNSGDATTGTTPNVAFIAFEQNNIHRHDLQDIVS